MVDVSVDERLLAWLLKRSAGSASRKLRVTGLLSAAAQAIKLDLLEARTSIRSLKAQGFVEYSADARGLPFAGFLTVKPPAVAPVVALESWLSALERTTMAPALREMLLPAYDAFAELDEEDLQLVATGLARLAKRGSGLGEHRYAFSLSACELLGSSKLLDRLPVRAKRALGIEGLLSTPRYVVVAAPAKPNCVVLIENTTTFEEAAAQAPHDVALIAAYGYGLNMMTDSVAGWGLVDSLSSPGCEVLSRRGHDHDLASLLDHPRLFFWGDLDREGLRIALALRAKLPQLSLSGLYEPMCDLVRRRETSHPYVAMAGKAGQAAWVATSDSTFNDLAKLCEQRAVDQEAIDLRSHLDAMQRGFSPGLS